MKSCPACHRSVPDSATVCPHPGCGKPLGAAAHAAIKRPPPPGAVRMNPPGKTPATAPALRQATGGGALRAVGLVTGLLLLLGLVGGVWYVAEVLKYAQLDPEIRLVRDEKWPQKLLVEYKPRSGGQLVARCEAKGQQREILNQIASGDAGEQRQTELPWSDIQPGDQVELTFRDGWWTATKNLTVPPSPRQVAQTKQPPKVDPPKSKPPKDDGATPHEPDTPKASDGEKMLASDKETKDEPKAVRVDQPVEVLGLTSAAAKPKDEKLVGTIGAAPELDLDLKELGLYSARTKPDRAKWIGQVGGTPESEQAVAAGLAWLARHQAADGHWGPDCLGSGANSRCERQHPCSGPGGAYEGAFTGLAVLAFQAGGHYYFNGRQYSRNVARGLDVMVAQQGLAGELVGSQNTLAEKPGEISRYNMRYMYEHAMGTFALAEACALAKASGKTPNARYLAAAIKAVRFIESQQHGDGGWRYSPPNSAGGVLGILDATDCSVSGWVMLALKTSREAEIKVDDQTLDRMVKFFKDHADPATGRTYYIKVGSLAAAAGTDALTGVGMMVDQFVLHQPQSKLVRSAAPYLADQAEGSWGAGHDSPSDFYSWYNCTLAMFQAGGDPWQRWNTVIRDYVQKLQLHGDECQRGSWEPNDSYGGEGGRIYSTALAVLTLEVYYRFAREQAEKRK